MINQREFGLMHDRELDRAVEDHYAGEDFECDDVSGHLMCEECEFCIECGDCKKFGCGKELGE